MSVTDFLNSLYLKENERQRLSHVYEYMHEAILSQNLEFINSAFENVDETRLTVDTAISFLIATSPVQYSMSQKNRLDFSRRCHRYIKKTYGHAEAKEFRTFLGPPIWCFWKRNFKVKRFLPAALALLLMGCVEETDVNNTFLRTDKRIVQVEEIVNVELKGDTYGFMYVMKTVTMDNCQYIITTYPGRRGFSVTHKGNCPNHNYSFRTSKTRAEAEN